MFVCCECCVLSGRSLCDGLITRPEESYRLWYVVVGDDETSLRLRRPWPALGCSGIGGKKKRIREMWNECKFLVGEIYERRAVRKPKCTSSKPIPVAARSKAQLCGRSISRVAGSNSAEGTDVRRSCCVFCR